MMPRAHGYRYGFDPDPQYFPDVAGCLASLQARLESDIAPQPLAEVALNLAPRSGGPALSQVPFNSLLALDLRAGVFTVQVLLRLPQPKDGFTHAFRETFELGLRPDFEAEAAAASADLAKLNQGLAGAGHEARPLGD